VGVGLTSIYTFSSEFILKYPVFNGIGDPVEIPVEDTATVSIF
jgi:hypothetical protein